MTGKKASNRQLTLLRKLRLKKYRESERKFIVEGRNAVSQVVNNRKIDIQEIFYDSNFEITTDLDTDIDHYAIPSDTFLEIADTENPQGILAVCNIPPESTLEELMGMEGVILATDRIQDPGNLGTIIRSATWFGTKGIIFGSGTVDAFHPKVVRSTAGATGTIPHITGDLRSILLDFESHDWKIMLLVAGEGATDLHLYSHDDQRSILVVGNEAHGIDEDLFTSDRIRMKIPSSQQPTDIESLNASIAVSIALYELSIDKNP